jgi:hypothetical protein
MTQMHLLNVESGALIRSVLWHNNRRHAIIYKLHSSQKSSTTVRTKLVTYYNFPTQSFSIIQVRTFGQLKGAILEGGKKSKYLSKHTNRKATLFKLGFGQSNLFNYLICKVYKYYKEHRGTIQQVAIQ